MGTKLFVGGLSWGTTDATLRQAFEPYGNVLEARVVLDRETGRSRGFGFVSFSTDAEAKEATEKLNGATVDGRTIRVNEAEDRRGGRRGPPRGGDRGGPRGRGGGGPEVVRTRRGGGGGPSGGRPGGGPRGPAAPVVPQFDGEEQGFSADRRRRDKSRGAKKKRKERSEEDGRGASTRRDRRESGRSWRDYEMYEDDDD